MIQVIIIEIRYLLLLAREVYEKLAFRVDEYSRTREEAKDQKSKKTNVSSSSKSKSDFLVKSLKKRAGNHILLINGLQLSSGELQSDDSVLNEKSDANEYYKQCTPDSLVNDNFSILRELESYLQKIMNL